MIRALFLSLSCLALLAAAGCAAVPCSDAYGYQQAQAGSELKVPAGLDRPAPDPAFEIPKVANNAPANADQSGVCLSKPPELVKSATSADSA
jgi:uncharacterized lipoprotein